eukprot:469549-Rhodomonas_salina.1
MNNCIPGHREDVPSVRQGPGSGMLSGMHVHIFSAHARALVVQTPGSCHISQAGCTRQTSARCRLSRDGASCTVALEARGRLPSTRQRLRSGSRPDLEVGVEGKNSINIAKPVNSQGASSQKRLGSKAEAKAAPSLGR